MATAAHFLWKKTLKNEQNFIFYDIINFENLSKKVEEHMEKFLKELIEWIKIIIVAVLLAFIIQIFITPTIVRGQSMYPTLDENNYLLIGKVAYFNNDPQRGDIIVFDSPLIDDNGEHKDLVKRVIAVAGDTIQISEGSVYLNGELLEENYINGYYTDGEVNIEVPEGFIFVMGDNRGNSMDSRSEQIGLVSVEEDVIGKVFIRLFPFNQITTF